MKPIEQIRRENRYASDVSHPEEHRIDDYEAAEKKAAE